jgi:YD repeat-containing protein
MGDVALNKQFSILGRTLLEAAENQTTIYTYDDAGNKLTEIYPDHVTSSTVGQTGYGIGTFTYDPVGRVDVRTDQQGDTCTYDYDLAGRLTSCNYVGMTGGPLSGQSYSDSFTYDAASRMLTALSGGYPRRNLRRSVLLPFGPRPHSSSTLHKLLPNQYFHNAGPSFGGTSTGHDRAAGEEWRASVVNRSLSSEKGGDVN